MTGEKALLVGCVKQKQPGLHPARDLYDSPLWRARLAYAERSGLPWFIVSAKYELVAPNHLIASYDLALTDLPAAERRAWGERVIAALESHLGSLEGGTIEIHAGGAYRRAIDPPLRACGAVIVAPTASIPGIGAQIAWYSSTIGTTRRQKGTKGEVEQALRDLDLSPVIVPAAEWPDPLTNLDQPGLYSWWVDETGAAALSRGLGTNIRSGRIYAGLTGATKWPSGTTGKHTLRQRIGRNHIQGRIRGSTFRLTLAAILREELALRSVGPKKLDSISESALTAWIRTHLSVAVHPCASPDALADIERHVLAVLDPPLNIDEVNPSPARQRLRTLRKQLAT